MKKSRFHFFAYISRMKYISRWGLMRNTQQENIQEHSHQVAVIAHALAMIKNTYFGGDINIDRVAVLGIFHDSNEILTGDLPTPIKYYNPEISQAYKKIEDVSKHKLLSMLPKELAENYASLLFHDNNEGDINKIVKAADKIAAYIKCLEEMKVGNKEFKKAGESIHKVIMDLNLQEVNYFMENFLPSFELPLDELD